MKIQKLNNEHKIIICGGRHFDNYDFLELVLDQFIENNNIDTDNVEIVSGCCEGADTLGEVYASTHNIDIVKFKPSWEKYGRAAGPIRNKQMIDYIKDSENPCVIAFISKKTKGTKNTIGLAKKNNIPVIEIHYDTENLDKELYEGIILKDNEFIFDWDNDTESDIINLSKRHIYSTYLNHNVRYYGYKVLYHNSDSKKFLSYIKTKDGYENKNVIEMIDRCVEEFYSDINEKFDLIIETKSSSDIVKIISEKISEQFDTPIIKLEKLPVDKLSLDIEKINCELKNKSDEYKNKFINYLNKRYIEPQHKNGKFSIAKIDPKYRKFIKPMYSFGDNKVDFSKIKKLLIVDENITTGETITQIVNLLKHSGYENSIIIFTLISNK